MESARNFTFASYCIAQSALRSISKMKKKSSFLSNQATMWYDIVSPFCMNLDAYTYSAWSNLPQEQKDAIENELIKYLVDHPPGCGAFAYSFFDSEGETQGLDRHQAALFLVLCAKYSFKRALAKFAEYRYKFEISLCLIHNCASYRSSSFVEHILHEYIESLKTENPLPIYEYCGENNDEKIKVLEMCNRNLLCEPLRVEDESIIEMLIRDDYVYFVYFEGEGNDERDLTDRKIFTPKETMAVIMSFAKYGFKPIYTLSTFSFVEGIDRDEEPRLIGINWERENEVSKLVRKHFPLERQVLINDTIPGYFGMIVSDLHHHCFYTEDSEMSIVKGVLYKNFYGPDNLFIKKGSVVRMEFAYDYDIDKEFDLQYTSDFNEEWTNQKFTLLKLRKNEWNN